MNTITSKIALVIMMAMLAACSTEQKQEGTEESVFEIKKPKASYGKIQHVDVGQGVDAKMAATGKEVFEGKCASCHKYDERFVGPSLGKVTQRRTPEYVMNMILDTETMIENDDTVKCLLQDFLMRMPNQNVDEKDARAVLEHLRDVASKSGK